MTLSPPTNRKTVLATLRQARRYVVQGWCQLAIAQAPATSNAWPRSYEATAVCAIGSVERATESTAIYDAAVRALDRAAHREIVHVNDRARSVETVLRIFDKAIAKEVAK